jgi:hypothetical protein
MSRDGYLPDDVRECDVPGNRPGDDHDSRCPQHEDQPETCVCGCDFEGHPKGHCESALGLSGDCGCLGRKLADPDCTCADLADQDASDKAEAAYEAAREARNEA